jgi:AraC-like DNA-binding protein
MRLERSCADAARADWLRSEPPLHGVARLRARLQRAAHATHRHDTYTVTLTEAGVQEFDYRGAVHRSLPGQIVLLHPDEAHNGRAGSAAGFAYRTLYIEPALLFDAVRALDARACTLPFVADPVVDDLALAATVRSAFDGPIEALRADEIALALARVLCRETRPARTPARRACADAALERAREYLRLHCRRIVRADELEAMTGLSRFALCVQFKRRYGTTPHRYLLMRRLDAVRARLQQPAARLSDVAVDTGFADQAHMSRAFKAAFGWTPRQFVMLHAAR